MNVGASFEQHNPQRKKRRDVLFPTGREGDSFCDFGGMEKDAPGGVLYPRRRE